METTTNARLDVIEAELQLNADAQGRTFTPYRAPVATETSPVDAQGFRTLIDGTKQYVGVGLHIVNPQTAMPDTPPVPAEFHEGATVKIRGLPPHAPLNVVQVGNGIVRVELTDEVKPLLNNPDHMGWFYPYALELVSVAG